MDTLKPTGHLEVWKIFEDGEEELHFEEKNVITSGMGVGLSYLFAGSGGSQISEFQILNFQLGVGGNTNNYGVSSQGLTTPLTAAQYSEDATTGSEVLIESLTPLVNDTAQVAQAFVRIPFSNIQRVTPTSVRFNLVIDSNTANDLANGVNEAGLYMRNPTGASAHSPILVAYRPFTGLTKTSTFSLLLKWTLTF